MVAAQQSASFDGKDTNPATQKTTAGKGNVVNPLEFSPASVELSEKVEETVCFSFLMVIILHISTLTNA